MDVCSEILSLLEIRKLGLEPEEVGVGGVGLDSLQRSLWSCKSAAKVDGVEEEEDEPEFHLGSGSIPPWCEEDPSPT